MLYEVKQFSIRKPWNLTSSYKRCATLGNGMTDGFHNVEIWSATARHTELVHYTSTIPEHAVFVAENKRVKSIFTLIITSEFRWRISPEIHQPLVELRALVRRTWHYQRSIAEGLDARSRPCRERQSTCLSCKRAQIPFFKRIISTQSWLKKARIKILRIRLKVSKKGFRWREIELREKGYSLKSLNKHQDFTQRIIKTQR